MMIVKIRDFEKEDGSVDWDAYHKAEVANGDRCMTCGGFTFNSILHDDCGPSECNSCKSMASDDDEVSHDSMVRCPHCGKTIRVDDLDEYDIYREGGFELDCVECDEEFTVQVQVSYSYTSPERIKDDGNN